jgi:hypothetical protein
MFAYYYIESSLPLLPGLGEWEYPFLLFIFYLSGSTLPERADYTNKVTANYNPTNLFGVPLEFAAKEQNGVPTIVEDTVQYLEQHGIAFHLR